MRARFESLGQREDRHLLTSGLPAVAFRLNRSLGSSRSAFSASGRKTGYQAVENWYRRHRFR